VQIQLKLFASLREITGVEFEVVDLPHPSALHRAALVLEPGAGSEPNYTLGMVRSFLAARGDQWAQALGADRPIRGAINQRMANETDLVSNGDEIAFFPPVTGG
jgi:molybdopterin synthase sulfur carrier subunit